MAAQSHSDDEFGYDFTTDDELSLLALDQIDAVPVKGHDAPLVTQGVDSLPTPVSLQEEVTYPNLASALERVESASKDLPTASTFFHKTAAPEPGDERSPLQKFRCFPRKPLSVSDLTSGAWCELQYEYTLTRLPFGRRTRTAAMKKGSKVHRKLEDEVHTAVKVEILTKEDGFALKLWNFVQGLRTLRETGLTRELEVWGMVDENKLVSGVIDSISYDHPDPAFEEELSSQESQLLPSQRKVLDYFPSRTSGDHKKMYLADVKTRGSLQPVSNAQLRPAKIQLSLYHRFLSQIASGKLDFFQVFRRFGLDPDDQFTDTFLAQIGSLHDEVFVDASSVSIPELSDPSHGTRAGDFGEAPQSEPDLVKYNSLRELLSLVEEEVRTTFPQGAESLGTMLRVQYLHRDDGRQLDVHDFPLSNYALDEYLAKYMQWWHGERKARGVTIEEAFKCKMCEFAEGCDWRQGLNDELVQRARARGTTKNRVRRET
ncbi:uncharacterized protein J7T54_000372 [Emericellopsis cladophorae]|uniref:Defects in morphology protein 1 n=1 Tax=Emericellopsis cladophorae TaxID=2686198 RepID=A0A9Q0BAN9_9HYPO|nr:uncharacterized protein J7T54_000372 [Emericellopsis cladophorae]KAI6778477.1 hypothetical protein J7T54_000372 [Emericellopsis cladophorae]